MKKMLLSALAVGALFAQTNVSKLEKEIQSLKQQIQQLQQQQISDEQKLYPLAANTHLFWSYDLRTTYDVITYKTRPGMVMKFQNNPDGTQTLTGMTYQGAKKYGNHIFTNRVILTGVAKPADNLKATVRLAVNSIYGANDASNPQLNPYQNLPWVANETPDDIQVRLKQAFFNYWFGPDNALMFSAGRRPSTEGFPANLIDNDPANSPLAHLINMEFDGFSFEIGNSIFSKISDKFSDWGTWLKFCAGRGYSSAEGTFNMYGLNYKDKKALKNMDFAGFLFIPYDDGQYSLKTETVWAWHTQGMVVTGTDSTTGMPIYGMADTGGYFGENVIFAANGIGNTDNDFLNNTTAFISFALSKTRGVKKHIIGFTSTNQPIYLKPHTGRSIWIGAQMPGFNNDVWGVNLVKGTKYWRSMTYGEDTLAGSIAAVRGNAIDIYYDHQIIPHLTCQLRATFFHYKHAASEGFFGMGMEPSVVDNMAYVRYASDFRAYIRYQF
ncbi:DUF3373 family protein [Caminibacter sp.]